MRRIRNILMMLCLGSAFVAGAAENGRIGVVNLEKIFREYYKSRIAEDAIKQQAEVYRTYLMRLNDQLRTLKEEARAARLNSQNLALSEADRKAAVEKADAKARQVSQKEAEIELYATEGSASLRKVEQQKREAIMAEIQQEIRRRAAAEGYAFVLDSSGKTMNEQPTLLIYPESCDFTAAVLSELNRTRTRKADTPSSKPAPPPEPVRN